MIVWLRDSDCCIQWRDSRKCIFTFRSRCIGLWRIWVTKLSLLLWTKWIAIYHKSSFRVRSWDPQNLKCDIWRTLEYFPTLRVQIKAWEYMYICSIVPCRSIHCMKIWWKQLKILRRKALAGLYWDLDTESCNVYEHRSTSISASRYILWLVFKQFA